MQPPADQIISVKGFLDILNETLNFAFPAVTVEGEVSSFKVNQGKWVFFDLKDDEATLPCFMPIYQLKVPLEDGMKIRVTGVPKLTKWGKFSFTAKSVALAGEGELKRAFEILKQKLTNEGLFADERKRILPRFPQTIGLITSGASAAYADFIKILNQRWGGLHILLADVQVQGAAAPDQIVNAIQHFNQMPSPPDVLVIIRGGGSLEDLQAFNSESVARAVAGSRTPTLVGVGHEVDTSLADYAADKRAATPTNAAQIVVPDRGQVSQQLNHYQIGMYRTLKSYITNSGHGLNRLIQGLEKFVRVPKLRTSELHLRIMRAQQQLILDQRQKLTSLRRLMASYDPAATLKRGYAIVRHEGAVVTHANRLQAGDDLAVQLSKGAVESTVMKVKD